MYCAVGRFTRDIELKSVNVGTEQKSVINNSIAVKGFKKDDTTFVDVTIWGKQAESVSKFCKKGGRVFITGNLKNKQYKVSDEKAVTTVYVQVSDIEFLDGNKSADETDNVSVGSSSDDDLPY